MAVLTSEIIKLAERKDTLKAIATTNHEGIPHITYKDSLHIEDGYIVFYDLIQSSQTNKNLVDAIWYDKSVAISFLGVNEENYQVIGKPVKCITAGAEFEKLYRRLREEGAADLNAIWYIRPEKFRDNSYFVRVEYEREKHPLIRRLDMLQKQ